MSHPGDPYPLQSASVQLARADATLRDLLVQRRQLAAQITALDEQITGQRKAVEDAKTALIAVAIPHPASDEETLELA